MSTAIEGGDGRGHLAEVTPEGKLRVTSRSEDLVAYRASVTVQTTSGQLVAGLAGRRGLWVQNQGANPVYLRFEAAAATNTDWLVGAGGEFRAEDFPYEGEVRAIAVGGTSVVLVLQMV